jgi:hypothetical protein
VSRANQQIEDDLARLGDDLMLADGWQRGVWSAIAQRRKKRKWRFFTVNAFAAVAATACVLWLALGGQTVAPPTLELQIRNSGANWRAKDTYARPGDELVAQARVGDSSHAELRVYRAAKRLVLHCPEDTRCSRDGDTLTATARLEAGATYQVLLLTSDQPIPQTQSSFDADIRTAAEAKARYQWDEVEVR